MSNVSNLEEEVLRIIREHPEVVIEALSRKPEALIPIIYKSLSLEKLATKEDLAKLYQQISEQIRMLINMLDKRFEQLIHEIDKRFEHLIHYIDKRFEDTNRRFEDMNKRFEQLIHHMDSRLGFLEKLLVAINAPILVAVIATLIKLLLTP